MTDPGGASGADPRLALKRRAAERAVEFVESGMIVGLGTGSTAIWAIRRIAELLREGILRDVVGIPTSNATAAAARRLGVPLKTLDDYHEVALTIDGADEVDPRLDLIKGAGGALLREKILAQASRREIIAVDDSKPSPALGTRCLLPVEVVPFGCRAQAAFLESLGAQAALRRAPDGSPYRSDEGLLILDCRFGPIADPAALARELEGRAGIVGHGLFLGLATDLIVAGPGGVRHVRRSGGTT